jgi:hypothetical protein
LWAPDKEEWAESNFFSFSLPHAVQLGDSSDRVTSTSLIFPHSVHKNSKSSISFPFALSIFLSLKRAFPWEVLPEAPE